MAGRKPVPGRGSGLALAALPRVNLLPPAEVERRTRTALIKRWTAAVAGTVMVALAVVGGSYWILGGAEQELAAEQTRTVQLTQELAGYSDVTRAVADRATLTQFRTESMGNDIAWWPVYRAIIEVLPNGTDLRGFALTPGDNPTDGVDPATVVGLGGELTLWSRDAADQARTVDRLRRLPLALVVDAGRLSAAPSDDESGFEFVVTFVANQTVYSGSFAPEGAE